MNDLYEKRRTLSSGLLMERFGVKTVRTLINWTRREKNPLPKPIRGGAGRGFQYQWRVVDIERWESREAMEAEAEQQGKAA